MGPDHRPFTMYHIRENPLIEAPTYPTYTIGPLPIDHPNISDGGLLASPPCPHPANPPGPASVPPGHCHVQIAELDDTAALTASSKSPVVG